jgi:cob(I)alamin adenosyltransferase
MKGYIQVYTGKGKGKTTAAFGLALRAAGRGLRVFIGQFCKKRICGEHKALKKFSDYIIIKRYGTDKFITGKPSGKDIRTALRGLHETAAAIISGKYGVVILDEINTAINLCLISADDLISIMDSKPDNVELVLTGRGANKKIIARADLVTEMREIKHYYGKGVKARKGIEY